MNNTDEYYTVDDRQYLNPNVPLQESEGFIQKLRDTQTADTQRINTETHNLGTNVPSNLGGLGGSESIWKGRYQDPQTNAMISDLKNAAQAQALSTTLTNLMNQKKKEYSDLYKKKAKDYENAQKTPATTGGGTEGGLDVTDPDGYTPVEDPFSKRANQEELYKKLKEQQERKAWQEAADKGNNPAPTNDTGQTIGTSNGSVPYTYEIDGKKYNMTVVPGKGVYTPMMSYNADGTDQFLKSIIKQGGQIYDRNGNPVNYSIFRIANKI